MTPDDMVYLDTRDAADGAALAGLLKFERGPPPNCCEPCNARHELSRS